MLAREEIEKVLNEVPLFAGCQEAVLKEIAAIAQQVAHPKGHLIYDAGDQATEMYVLLQGLVAFKTSRGTGLLNVQPVMKRHMIFGWASLIPEHPRRLGSAKCLEDSQLLSIDGDKLFDILRRNPDAGFVVMTRLSSLIAKTFVDDK